MGLFFVVVVVFCLFMFRGEQRGCEMEKERSAMDDAVKGFGEVGDRGKGQA